MLRGNEAGVHRRRGIPVLCSAGRRPIWKTPPIRLCDRGGRFALNVTMIGYMPEDEGFSIDVTGRMCRMRSTRDALPSFTVLSADAEGEPGGEAGKIGDRQAKLYTYTYRMGGYTYKVRQAVCTYSTMVYTVTYTALEPHF